MIERMRGRRSWWRSPDSEEPAAAEPLDADATLMPAALLEGSPLFVRYRISGRPSFMFIGLFGMTGEAITECADLVDEELGQKGLVPVYLVDQPEFAPFRAKQRLFEYLPCRWQSACRSTDLDWPFYLRRRYLLLRVKWRPIDRIDFGNLPDWLPVQDDSAIPADAKTPRP